MSAIFMHAEPAFPPVRSIRFPEAAPSEIPVRIRKSSYSSHCSSRGLLVRWFSPVAVPAHAVVALEVPADFPARALNH